MPVTEQIVPVEVANIVVPAVAVAETLNEPLPKTRLLKALKVIVFGKLT